MPPRASAQALFSIGFRPFFLLAGGYAVLAIAVWLWLLDAGTAQLGKDISSVTWHAHEMLFGYAVAVIAGFLLTAVRNWTGLETLQGGTLALLALVSPMVKTICLTLIHLSKAPARLLPALEIAGKLAMADVFLIAVYITLAKGIAVGRVETAWGLYLFTACILTSLFISWRTEQSRKPTGD